MTRTLIKLAVALAVIIPCLWIGTAKIADYRASVVPDPAKAEPSELVAYTMSKYFRQLSPQDQLRFARESTKRYTTMTQAQRKAIEEQLQRLRKQDPDVLRESLKQWFMTLARQYLDLPPKDRGPWLDRNLSVFMAMDAKGQHGQKDAEKTREESQKDGERLTPERQRDIVDFFQKEAMSKSTAKERAMFMAVVKDLGPRMAAKKAAESAGR